MEMEKKNLAIIILAVVLAASGVGNVILGIAAGAFQVPEEKNVLKIGTTEGGSPAVLDPVDSWDSVSNDMIAHTCDTLWTYELYAGDYDIIMSLATNYSWNSPDNDILTVDLRDDVYFHDGDKFDADDVKFTFDRIKYFLNVTGTLPDTTHVADPASLFFDLEGNCVLNQTIVVSDYRVQFELYEANAIFVPLLAYRAWSILSDGGSTPADKYLEFAEEDILVGTGPFKYNPIIPGEELKFTRFDLYWGESTFWDEIIWVFYPDSTTAGNALLGGEVHRGTFPISMIATVDADPDLVFINLETSFIYRYWGLNNRKINNSDVRKAIAYAYNYTYFIEVVRLNYSIRATHFLPPGFPYYNASFTAPTYDTGIARQAMLDGAAVEGWDTTGLTADPVGADATNDANWQAASLVTYKVLEHEGWTTGIEMNEAMRQDMLNIGIEVESDVMDWPTYIDVSTHNEDRLEIWYTGWGPDYMDPFNMIEPLLSNMSSANHIQLQDAEIMGWLKEYQQTLPTEPAVNPKFENRKAELLYFIQNKAINEEYVELAVSYDMVMYGHHKSLGNVCYNIKRDLWCRDSYLIPGVETI
jgi:ABC-type transport system substrate-binding protein